MSRRLDRRAVLAGIGSGVLMSLSGCSALPRIDDDAEYRIESLQIMNTHERPHDVLVVITDEDTATFARSVQLDAAERVDTGIDSVSEFWEQPVDGPGDYHLHVKVDDDRPRSHRYTPSPTDSDTHPSIRAVLSLNSTEGDLYFNTVN